MTHYSDQRWIATPNPEVTAIVLKHRDDPAFVKRFYDKVDVGFDIGDCHIWTGALSSEGYGDFWVGGRTVRAHRVAWLLRYGDIHPELYLDHVWPICLGRWCVNPDHLELVTNEENVRRGTGAGKLNQRELRFQLLQDRQQTRELEGQNNGH